MRRPLRFPTPTASAAGDARTFQRFSSGAVTGTWLGLVLLGAGCGLPGTDPAADAEDARRLVAMRDREIARCSVGASNMTVIEGDMVMLPSCRKSQEPGVQALGVNGRHVLFANFDGVDVRPGDTSLENEGLRNLDKQDPIEIARYAPGAPDAKRQADILKVHKLVAGWYADMNIDVVLSRPLSGDYQMTVVGDRESIIGEPGGVVGISPVDCKNANDSNVNYAFSASLKDNPDQVAITIAHENGHAYGLHHTDNQKDIMFPSVSPADGFRKGIVAKGPCGLRAGIDEQDSFAVLIENLGARPAGVEKPGMREPPTVEILSPREGESVGRDVTVAVRGSSSASQGIDHITLGLSLGAGGDFRGNHPIAELRPPFSATQIRLSHPGNYQLTATAYDAFGNVRMTTVSFTAATITCKEPNDCAPGQRCKDNVCLTPTLPPPPPSGPTEDSLRPYGSVCDKSSECRGGICAQTPVGQICTHYCNGDRLCAGGLECVDGICLPQMYPRSTPKGGQLGGKCVKKEDCFTGECSPFVDVQTPRYCTKTCDPEIAWACPSTMACQESDAPGGGGKKTMCIAKPTGQMGEGGGCSVAATQQRSQAGWLSGLFGLLMVGWGLRLRQRRAVRVADGHIAG